MSREEKIEEARRSGLIKNEHDLKGPKAIHLCCKNCGSDRIQVGTPGINDDEKGCEIPYYCTECGYHGLAPAKIKGISQDGTLSVDLIPDGLVGVVGHMIPGMPGGY